MCAHTSVALRYYNYVFTFNYQFKSEKKKCGVDPNSHRQVYIKMFPKTNNAYRPYIVHFEFSLWRDLRKEVAYIAT